MRPSLLGASLLPLVLLTFACDSTSEESSSGGSGGVSQTLVCEPGQVQACELCDGVRTCEVTLPDPVTGEPRVTAWSACCEAPEPPGIGGFGGASGGTTGSGGGAASPAQAGAAGAGAAGAGAAGAGASAGASAAAGTTTAGTAGA